MVEDCVICRRRQPTDTLVCEPDRQRLAERLRELPARIDALRWHLAPGATVPAERVHTSRTGSPAPVRLDALSLLGPGCVDVTESQHPSVRRWRETSEISVEVIRDGKPRTETRRVTTWFQQVERDEHGELVWVGDGDQHGVLPAAVWLAGWADAWRRCFGHHRPPARTTPATAGALTRQALWAAATHPGTATALAQAAVVHAAWRSHRAQVSTGMGAGDTDTPAPDWDLRFPDTPASAALTADVRYLLTWLERACARPDTGIVAFATGLQALGAELTRVLGETPDQQWLGRCPVSFADHETGTSAACGAGLWQDPHASQVQCPRCQATWGQRELLALAYDIRRVWPLDRRRRYHADDIDALTCPACTGCGAPVRVSWREVTATTDTRRWWRPERIACPADCQERAR